MVISQFCVYIMSNEFKSMLYTGYTGNLRKRVSAHRSGNGSDFVRWHNLTRLVYYEFAEDANAAKQREKQIKRSTKIQKEKLIETMNPEWEDLYDRL